MKDCIKCGIACLAIGMVVGGIVVAKNKKLASVINDGTDKVAKTFTEVKDDVEEKIEEVKMQARQKQAEEDAAEQPKTSRKKN